MRKSIALAIAGMMASASCAFASDIIGNWQRSDGTSRIRMSKCGDAVCGVITAINKPDSPAKVGQQVFSNLKQDGSGWSGSAFNPEDGKTYSGSATVSGNSMSTKGCALGGLICKTVNWTRH